MAWIEQYLKEYAEDRNKLFRSRWFTGKSWLARSKESTKYQELERLLSAEREFNSKWLKRIEHAIVKYKLKPSDIVEAKLLTETHISKHKERDFFIIIAGILFTASVKAFADDTWFSIAIVTTALFLGYERLFGNSTKNTLEEFKAILEVIIKHNKVLNSDP